MISRRTFMKLGAGGVLMPLWMRATYASQGVTGGSRIPGVIIFDGISPTDGVGWSSEFVSGLACVFGRETSALRMVSSLGEIHPTSAIGDVDIRHSTLVIGVVPDRRWMMTLRQLTLMNMSVVFHGEHTYGSNLELNQEHRLISAVNDSLAAQVLVGHIDESRGAMGQWVVHATAPTSGLPLSVVGSRYLTGKLSVREARPPKIAYGDGYGAVSGKSRHYACSWADDAIVDCPGIRTTNHVAIRQSDSNRLYALRTCAFDRSGSACEIIQSNLARSLGLVVGFESLRAMEHGVLRNVSALPWASGVPKTLSNGVLRTDMFCGGQRVQGGASHERSRVELRTFIAMNLPGWA